MTAIVVFFIWARHRQGSRQTRIMGVCFTGISLIIQMGAYAAMENPLIDKNTIFNMSLLRKSLNCADGLSNPQPKKPSLFLSIKCDPCAPSGIPEEGEVHSFECFARRGKATRPVWFDPSSAVATEGDKLTRQVFRFDNGARKCLYFLWIKKLFIYTHLLSKKQKRYAFIGEAAVVAL
jgi:hypothetical protein